MIVRKKIELNIADSTPPPRVTAVQGDSGREYEFILIGNGRITVPDSAGAQIYVIKPSGAKIYNSCTIENGNIVAKTTTQMLAEAGNATAQLQIIDGDTVRSYTFVIEIKKKIVDGTAIESKDEFTAFEEALEQSKILLPAVQQATEEATLATEEATAATALCITSTTDANNAATAANTAAGKANTAATIANTATSNANTAYQNYRENNAASSDKLKYPRTVNGIDFDGTKDTTMYALCETAANTVEKTVTVDGFHLKNGSMLVVFFVNGNTAKNPTLNVNGTGGQFILNRGFAPGANEIKKSQDYLLVYNGSYWYIVGDVDTDSGWNDAELTTNFEKYSESSVARYRKVGNRVTVEGLLKPKSVIAGSATATTMFTLPTGFRPIATRGCLCQGSSVNNWFLSVQPTGAVGIARYGTTTTIDIPTSAWLSFYFEFFID